MLRGFSIHFPPRLWLEVCRFVFFFFSWQTQENFRVKNKTSPPCLCTDQPSKNNRWRPKSVEISAFLAGKGGKKKNTAMFVYIYQNVTCREHREAAFYRANDVFTTLHPVLWRLSKVTEKHFSWFLFFFNKTKQHLQSTKPPNAGRQTCD